MTWIVRLELVAGLDRTKSIRGFNLYDYVPNLTRLDDFLKVEVAGFASARRGSIRSNVSKRQVLIRAQQCRDRLIDRRTGSNAQTGFLRELELLTPEIAYWKILLDLFSGIDIAKVALVGSH